MFGLHMRCCARDAGSRRGCACLSVFYICVAVVRSVGTVTADWNVLEPGFQLQPDRGAASGVAIHRARIVAGVDEWLRRCSGWLKVSDQRGNDYRGGGDHRLQFLCQIWP